MSILQAMWGFDGRISRKYYWLATIVWTIAFFVIFFILVHWLSGGQWLNENYDQASQAAMKDSMIAIFIASVVGLYPYLAMSIKRLHDLNLSGWWCLPVYALGLISWLAFLLGLSDPWASPNLLLDMFFGWLPLAVSLLFTIVLYFIRGTAGPNRYGPDPLARNPAPVATS